jgi:pSer/pThr/pTyr-binding forkhead associated (FHA) protein
MPEHAMLMVYCRNSRQERLLDKHLHTIGRSQSCDIVIEQNGISRLHATLIFIEEDEYNSDEKAHHLIYDGDANIDGKPSLLGLYVNGVKVDVCKLSDDDLIELGENSKARGLYIKYFKFYQAGKKTDEGQTSLPP